MASVNELIQAAEYQKSPFVKFLEGAAQGIGQAQNQGLDRAIKLIQLEQMRQDRIKKIEEDKRLREQLGLGVNQATKKAFNGVQAPNNNGFPQLKMNQKITSKDGYLSRSIEYVTPDEDKNKLSAEKYVDSQGQTRIGKWDQQKGLIQSPDDPLAPQGVPDKSLQREISKAKVTAAQSNSILKTVIPEIDRVQELNKNSYGGYLGAAQMKLRSATGIGDEGEKFKNTADVINTMQAQVAKVLKSTFGAQLSDGERAYLNGVYGALPTLSRTERDIAMTNVKKMLEAKAKGDQEVVNTLLEDAGIPIDYKANTETQSEETPEQRKARLIKELSEAK